MPNTLEGLVTTVKEHSKIHEDVKGCLDHHAKEIESLKAGQQSLEEWQKKVDEWRSASDENYRDLKMTIVNENRDTQKYFRDHMKDQFELLKIATQQRYEADKLEASNSFEIAKSEQEIKKENRQQFWGFIGKIFTGGGIGAAVIFGIMSLFGITL